MYGLYYFKLFVFFVRLSSLIYSSEESFDLALFNRLLTSYIDTSSSESPAARAKVFFCFCSLFFGRMGSESICRVSFGNANEIGVMKWRAADDMIDPCRDAAPSIEKKNEAIVHQQKPGGSRKKFLRGETLA